MAGMSESKSGVRDRPILMSGPMVRAILDGRKSETRRPVKLPKKHAWGPAVHLHPTTRMPLVCHTEMRSGNYWLAPHHCPYGAPDTARLWVRETWAPLDVNVRPIHGSIAGMASAPHVAYQADHRDKTGDGPDRMVWRHSIHMPRWASRLTLEVKAVRVERLQEITPGGVMAEGFEWLGAAFDFEHGIRGTFIRAWDDMYGRTKGHAPDFSWARNPWCWIVQFRRIAC